MSSQVETFGHDLHAGFDVRLRQAEQARVQHQVLAHRQLAVERKALGHEADATAGGEVVGSRAACRTAAPRPRSRGSSPVSIFMVVVLPQPLEPRKPKISPRRMRKLTRSTAVKSPKRMVRSRASMAISVCGVGRLRHDLHRPVAGALRFRKQCDEGLFQRGAAGTRQQLGGRAGGEHATRVHGRQPVETLGLLHVAGGHQYAHARSLGANVVDQRPELAARERVDAGGGLVEDQQLGVVDQRTAQSELLLHAARELAGRTVCKRREPGGGQ